MLVSITSKLFDLGGAMTVDVPFAEMGEYTRRNQRLATMDGGAVATDFGFSDADRTITLRWSPTLDEDETARRLVQLHSLIRVSTPTGLFECIPGGYSLASDGRGTLTLLPIVSLT